MEMALALGSRFDLSEISRLLFPLASVTSGSRPELRLFPWTSDICTTGLTAEIPDNQEMPRCIAFAVLGCLSRLWI